jgi:hypothetical protein
MEMKLISNQKVRKDQPSQLLQELIKKIWKQVQNELVSSKQYITLQKS